ncbi:MAG: hypothetical protein D6678_07635 [Zetaproteobacteria bacterium]|nr:MAG: hypothetical protein D6678_07635 [Zetaproteobacteria bacterium]
MKVVSWQSIALPVEGTAVVFEFQLRSQASGRALSEQGFAIRFAGGYHVYRNRCPHAGSPLDWQPGQFFAEDGQTLLCHTHGARFDPATGACLAGPCPHGLQRLPFQAHADTLKVPACMRE